jgi:uncharacterized repeat protein (TIGR01451 family)
MSVPRANHSATVLPSGQVLVAGGWDDTVATFYASSELYDPSTGAWTTSGNLVAARGYHTAVLLSDGQVLVAGGESAPSGAALTSAEVYTPVSTAHTLTIQKAGGGSGTVTSSPAGIDCGTDCSESYIPGTAVTLTATADANTTFSGWSGAVTSRANPLQLTMDADQTLTATFKQNADLQLTLGAPASDTVGTPFTYTLRATDRGPFASSGVTVSDILPTALSVRTASWSQGTIAITTLATGAQKVSWNVGALASGAKATLTLRVVPNVAGTLVNTATIGSAITHDPNTGNNKDSATTTVTAPAGATARVGTTAELTSPEPPATPDPD